MADKLADRLAEEFARALPGALDQDTLVALAAPLRPYINVEPPTVELLTATDAASRARVHVETIYRAVRSGELQVAGRVGRSLRISASALDEWLKRTAGHEDGKRTARRRPQRRSGQRDRYSLREAFQAGTRPERALRNGSSRTARRATGSDGAKAIKTAPVCSIANGMH